MPQPALLPHYSPLCDSNLVGCLDIDDFGPHAYAHLMVLPKTDQRDAAAVFPYGVTLGLFGRFAGGFATDFNFWQQGGGVVHQHGPLRLNLTGLLWPLLPLSQAPQMSTDDDGATHCRPAPHLRICAVERPYGSAIARRSVGNRPGSAFGGVRVRDTAPQHGHAQRSRQRFGYSQLLPATICSSSAATPKVHCPTRALSGAQDGHRAGWLHQVSATSR